MTKRTKENLKGIHHKYNMGMIAIVVLILAIIYVTVKSFDLKAGRAPKFVEIETTDVNFNVKVEGLESMHSGTGAKMMEHGQIISID